MLVGSMIWHEVHYNLYVTLVSRTDKTLKVTRASKARVDAKKVGNVVAVVCTCCVKGGDPDRVCTQSLDVVKVIDPPLEVAAAKFRLHRIRHGVVVAHFSSRKAVEKDLIDNGICEPRLAHAFIIFHRETKNPSWAGFLSIYGDSFS